MEQTILFVNDSVSARSGETIRLKPYSLYHSDTHRQVPLTIVAVVGERMELGREGDLVWHIPEDLKHFKEITLGGAVIMGRKTWESLPVRPLPGRLNIVVSRNPDFRPEGAVKAASLEEAVEAAKGSDVFIIGGESIYRAAMPMADRLELTHVLATSDEADRWFPEVSPEIWQPVKVSEIKETKSGIKFKFTTYLRK